LRSILANAIFDARVRLVADLPLENEFEIRRQSWAKETSFTPSWMYQADLMLVEFPAFLNWLSIDRLPE
jgi:hypothetical protein